MRIQHNPPQTFTGYDARVLKGIFVTDRMSAHTLDKLLKDSGIDVFTPNIASKSIRKEYAELEKSNEIIWAQDYFTFLKDKAVLFDFSREHLKRVLRGISEGVAKPLHIKALKADFHIRGGNYFICDVDGKQKLLIGENKKLLFPEKYIKALQDSSEICFIPRVD